MPIVGDLKGVLAGMLEAAREGRRRPARRAVGRRDRRMARPLPVLPPEHGRERADRRDRPRGRHRRAVDATRSGGTPSSPPRWASTRCGPPSSCPGSSRAPSSRRAGSAPWASASRPPSERPWRTRMHGGLHRRRRVVPDEQPGDGHGRHPRRAGEGARSWTTAASAWCTSGRSCSTTSAIPDAARARARLREAGRGVRLGGRARGGPGEVDAAMGACWPRRGPISGRGHFARAERYPWWRPARARQRHGRDRRGRGRRAHRRARCRGLPGPGGRSCRAGRHLPLRQAGRPVRRPLGDRSRGHRRPFGPGRLHRGRAPRRLEDALPRGRCRDAGIFRREGSTR